MRTLFCFLLLFVVGGIHAQPAPGKGLRLQRPRSGAVGVGCGASRNGCRFHLRREQQPRDAQEEFLNQFRRGGVRFGDPPTNLEMTRSVVDDLRRAGYTEEQSMALARSAIHDRVKYSLLGGEQVPRIPSRINQTKSEPANEP